VILHVDIDAFFASVEQVLDATLRGRPVVVGSADPRRGVVASASYEARRFGLHAGMPVIKARELCPHAVYLGGSYREYARFSRQVFAVLEAASPALEALGMDEAYVDLSGCERLHGLRGAGPLGRMPFERSGGGAWVRREARAVPPRRRGLLPEPWRWVAAVALRIKRLVRETTGLNVSVGCAANKLAAKAASDFAKPSGVALIEPGREADFFLTLPLADVPGLGRALLERLAKWNVRTTAQARALPPELLNAAFGARAGPALHGVLRGCGEAQLQPPARPKSVSRETTFWSASADRVFLEAMLLYLCERAGAALRREGLAGRTVRVRLRYEEFTTMDVSRSARRPVCEDEDIFETARELLLAHWTRSRRLRLIGVSVQRLEPAEGMQTDLFDATALRRRRVDRCLDALRQRFGFTVVQRGLALRLEKSLEKGGEKAPRREGYKLRTPALSR
jgi:DNA polymerase-4